MVLGYVTSEHAVTCGASAKAEMFMVMEWRFWNYLPPLARSLWIHRSCYGNRFNIIAWACMLVNEGREHEVFTPGLRDTAPREDLKIASPCYNVSCRYTFGFSFNEATCEALNTITTSCTELVMAVLYFFPSMEFKAENPVLSILIHPVS